MRFERIVVPVDFSPPSMRALETAIELAKPLRAELLVVHALQRLDYVAAGEMWAPAFDTGMLLEQFGQAASKELAAIATMLAKRRVRARTILDIGPAYEVIVDTAKKRRADLIVISTHGRTGLAHVLMGSVAERVVRHAPCAVLTIRGLDKGRRTLARKGRKSARRPATSPAKKANRRKR